VYTLTNSVYTIVYRTRISLPDGRLIMKSRPTKLWVAKQWSSSEAIDSDLLRGYYSVRYQDLCCMPSRRALWRWVAVTAIQCIRPCFVFIFRWWSSGNLSAVITVDCCAAAWFLRSCCIVQRMTCSIGLWTRAVVSLSVCILDCLHSKGSGQYQFNQALFHSPKYLLIYVKTSTYPIV